MRICLVSQEYPPETGLGGIGTQTWNKARALTAAGHTVHVLSCLAGGVEGQDLVSSRADDIHVHRVQPAGEEPGREFTVFNPAVYSLGYSWKVARYLARLTQLHEFDLVEFPDYGAEGFVHQLNRSEYNWVPIVVQLHGPLAMFTERLGWPPADSNFHRVGAFMEAVSIQQADGLMACSANIADFTAGFYGVPRERIAVVHCGVDAEMFTPGDGRRAGGRPPTVLFIGNLVPTKGLETVFQAVLRLRSTYPDIRLKVLGKVDEEYEERFQTLLQSSEAAAIMDFLGFIEQREQLPQVYRDADVFCSPAYHEVGIANVYIEAMACGLPVVACSTGGAPEAVIDGQSGLLVPPNDVEATVSALDRILADRVLRANMGRDARRRVDEYFAMDRYIARVLDVYERAREDAGRSLADLLASCATTGGEL